MNWASDPKAGVWKISRHGRVAKHDVVHLSLRGDPMQGMPIGNGDIGLLCRCEDSRLIVPINRRDLWDGAEIGRLHNRQGDEEEHSTTLSHDDGTIGKTLRDSFSSASTRSSLR